MTRRCENLVLVTLKMPREYLSAIDRLVEEHLIPSRTEAVRLALRDFFNFTTKRELSDPDLILEFQDFMEKLNGDTSRKKVYGFFKQYNLFPYGPHFARFLDMYGLRLENNRFRRVR